MRAETPERPRRPRIRFKTPSLNLLAIVALGAIAFGFYRVRMPDLSPTAAHALVEAGARLVDVRAPEEFEAGHLMGAVNLPITELKSRMDELERDRPLVLYCTSGVRSAAAARVLRASGFKDVHNLGAMSNW